MILIPVAVGELVDKITILEIKRDRIAGADKRANVEKELRALRGVARDVFGDAESHIGLQANLKAVNELLWDIENAKRQHEAEQRFDADFIQLARNVYLFNDRRAAIKREINLLFASEIVEEKSHPAYSPTDLKSSAPR
jgi:hypothetical protein